MGGIANVVGIPINVITERELLGLMKLYSSNDYMNVVYLISVSTCQNLVEQEEMKLSLKTADLVLPGEKILLSKTNRHKIRGVVNNYRYILYMLRNHTMFRSVFIIGKNQKQVEQLGEVIQNQNGVIEINGTYAMDQGSSDESIINHINSAVPDLLLIAQDSPELEGWMESHRAKLNAKLCIGIGDMVETIIKENVKPSGFVQKLGMEQLYFKTIQKKYSQSNKKERILQSLIAEYNTKKR